MNRLCRVILNFHVSTFKSILFLSPYSYGDASFFIVDCRLHDSAFKVLLIYGANIYNYFLGCWLKFYAENPQPFYTRYIKSLLICEDWQ